MIFRKWGGVVKSRLELFREFICSGGATRPLVVYMPAIHSVRRSLYLELTWMRKLFLWEQEFFLWGQVWILWRQKSLLWKARTARPSSSRGGCPATHQSTWSSFPGDGITEVVQPNVYLHLFQPTRADPSSTSDCQSGPDLKMLLLSTRTSGNCAREERSAADRSRC